MEPVAVTVSVSSPLRVFCGSEAELNLRAASLRQLLDELARSHPKLYRSVCDETGRVRRHVNVFVNDKHMSDRGGLDAPLASGDVVTLLPAVSGG